MAHTELSLRDFHRIEVLAQVDDGRLSVQNGANLLDVTRRQMFRLLKTYRTEGGTRVVRRSCAITFQLAEVAVTGPMVCAILDAIRRLRTPPLCA